jgi:hypothetical protein
MKISVKVDYACRVMAELARLHSSGELAQIEQLAKTEEVPASFLAQILGKLRTHRGKLALDVDGCGASHDHGCGAGAAVPSLVRSIATKEMREFESRSNSTPARCAESSTGAL